MALRDSWHRALVYFGLAEERDPVYRDDPYEQEPQQAYEERRPERSGGRRASSPRRRDDFDDMFTDEPRVTRRSSPQAAPRGGNGGNQQVHLVIPKSFNDAQQIADRFKDQVPVVLNLQTTDVELSKRLIDFASGLTYALDGGMQRVADKVFMLTPRNVDLSAEQRAELVEKGFFNQS